MMNAYETKNFHQFPVNYRFVSCWFDCAPMAARNEIKILFTLILAVQAFAYVCLPSCVDCIHPVDIKFYSN